MTKRSHFGCQTCKIRKVKCDETQPYCKRCTESGRKCDGPPKNKTIFVTSVPPRHRRVRSKTTSPLSSGSTPPKQLTSMPDLQGSGRRALTFFIERAGPALGGELDQEFWHASVLQLSHQSAMVRAAVLAVSTLYENPLSNPLQWPSSLETNFRKPEHRQAFQWYNQSLNGMSEVMQSPQDQEQLQLALTTCILFACVEFQQLNVVNSMQLMKCGYGLLGQDTARSLMTRSPVIRHVLLPIFIRQTIVLLLHGYPLPQGWLPPDLMILGSGTSTISSLQDARTHLYLLMLGGFGIIGTASSTFDPAAINQLRIAQAGLHEKLRIWRSHTDAYINFLHHSCGLTAIDHRAIALMNIYYLVSTIWLTTCLDATELIYDTLTPQFTAILDATESILSSTNTGTATATATATTPSPSPISYTFEMGIIAPLYFVGWRCRIPSVRRRALRLLYRAPAQESLFHRDVEIWALIRIVQTEEGLPDGTDVENVNVHVHGPIPPEERRLRHVLVRWDTGADGKGRGRPHLVCSRYVLKEDENGQLIEVKPDIVPL